MLDTIDLCCGGGAFHFATDPHTIYGDIRATQITVTDRSHNNADGKRTITIAPNVLWDFRTLPFADETFTLAIFDPPHFTRAGKASYMAAKYGVLSCNWREDLRWGFDEAFRVLRPRGVLNFKWNDTHLPLSEILPLAGRAPSFGQQRQKTHWLIFRK